MIKLKLRQGFIFFIFAFIILGYHGNVLAYCSASLCQSKTENTEVCINGNRYSETTTILRECVVGECVTHENPEVKTELIENCTQGCSVTNGTSECDQVLSNDYSRVLASSDSISKLSKKLSQAEKDSNPIFYKVPAKDSYYIASLV